ncbi:MAG: sulfatase-like hydrolase/transferase [Bacteroidales bacterium]
MMKIHFLAILFILILCAAGCKNDPGVYERPNIVLIMVDDMGHEVLGSYGGTSYSTPNLDKLAETGVRFTNCYSAPKCSPSRVKIMTGRYAFRTTKVWGYIPPDEITFGHMLDSAGYKVALSGKWQMALLKDDPDHIQKMGFEESAVFGYHEGPRYYEPFIYQNGKILEGIEQEYGPDLFCDFLTDFIRRNRNQPFFAYYPMAVAHEISNDLDTPPPTGPSGHYQSYKELVEYADLLVGRVVSTLDELGLRENTLILFTGDNGTPRDFITAYRDGEYITVPVVSHMGDSVIPGGKGLLTDAGTHVPLIANWKGKTPAGTTCDDLIDFSDFLPTLAEISGSELPGVILDGVSFAPRIFGKPGNPREWIYQDYEENAWVRDKQWKLYTDGRLVNVSQDPLEKNPVLPGEDSEVQKEIRRKFQSILAELHE